MIDPGFDFSSNGAAFAYTISAFAVPTTRCPVQEVLLHAITNIRSKVRTTTADTARLTVAGICVVGRGIIAHQGLALEVTTCALAAGAV